jgi:acetylornithine/N-succinyldiaminopimelate aminotransferase
LRAGLEAIRERHPGVIAEVRGVGLLAGIRVPGRSADLLRLLQDGGLVTAPAAEDVVRLLPPLTLSEDELAAGLAMIETACADLPA